MHFGMQNYLKSNCNYIAKHTLQDIAHHRKLFKKCDIFTQSPMKIVVLLINC